MTRDFTFGIKFDTLGTNRDAFYNVGCQVEGLRMKPILDRYDGILAKLSPAVRQEDDPGTSPAHLRWMIRVLRGDAFPAGNGKMTPLKMHRWLGFIQGNMIAHGALTVSMERELTRGFLTEH